MEWSPQGPLQAKSISSANFFSLRAQLFLVLTNLAAAAIDLVLMGFDVDQFLVNGGGGIVGMVWLFFAVVPLLAVLVRRLHDTGRSGW